MKNSIIWWILGIAILLVIGYVTVSSMTGNVVYTGSTVDDGSTTSNDSTDEKDYIEVTIDTQTGETVYS